MNNQINLKELPIGEQSIIEILNNNYIYIDKTEYIYNLITSQKYYFLSRPRRFGKSLLISTFIEIFSGNKELFKNCWIYNSNYDWKKYPIIHLDFGTKKEDGKKDFYDILIEQLIQISKNYKINLENQVHVSSIFNELIRKLYENHGQVIFLVDEYDKPILDNIDDLEKANENRDILAGIFSTAKSLSGMLRFQFITGITKFAKTSLFSGANNLRDISMTLDYNCLLGYTQNELEFYFKDYINLTSQSSDINLSVEDLLKEIKRWYNGYLFTTSLNNNQTVYNPFSILNFFNDKIFFNYWFETATPKFLVNLIKKNEYSIFEDEKTLIPISYLNTFEIENIDFISLLFQTGYLTIESYDKKTEALLLKYPNYEVEKSFTETVVNIIDNNLSKKILSLVPNFTKYLNKNDIEGFIKEIQNLITGLVYFNHIKNEHYYLSMAVIIIKMIGIRSFSETATNYGRIDLMFEYLNNIYIFEFKLNKSALDALNQIKEKAYYKEYLNKGKTLYLIGINILFEKDKPRNINEWIFEEIGK